MAPRDAGVRPPLRGHRDQRRIGLSDKPLRSPNRRGEGVANTMRLVADNVESKIIPESGHSAAEEAPEALLAAIAPLLAQYGGATSR